jgi:hypothetical protein
MYVLCLLSSVSDDDSDLEDDIVQLDDLGLASALDDLCVSKPRADPTDALWNRIEPAWAPSAYLAGPPSHFNRSLGLCYGNAEMPGQRPYMEDRVFTNPCLEGSLSPNQVAFFGVFDGHNGHEVAEALQSGLCG